MVKIMQNKYLQLNDVSAYKIAFHLSNYACPVAKNEHIGVWDNGIMVLLFYGF